MKFIITSILMGIALAMDACAVSMANGLKWPKMKTKKIFLMALIFGMFQGIMPLFGYLIGSAVLSRIEWIIPVIALILLTFIGVRMILEGIKCKDGCCPLFEDLTFKLILIQAIATSIDALSVGVSIANYSLINALICSCIIALVTGILCLISVRVGEKFGAKLGCKAQILGGIILIIIGAEIFISGMFL